MKRESNSDAPGFSFCHYHAGETRRRVEQVAHQATLWRARNAGQRRTRVRTAKRALSLVAFVMCFLHACATPAERTLALAERAGASVDRIDAGSFEHVVIRNRMHKSGDALHIYFSGDGSPWSHRTQISRDPTPREPLELRLMLEDPSASIYIGRPCYIGLAQAPGCSASLWTDGRYSDAVVSSMTSAVDAELGAHPASRHVVLIGYSGGGVLAMLVAERIARVDVVVTIAANLDIDEWTTLHGYSPLSASINPAKMPRWRTGLRQVHLVGERDENVPPHLVRVFAAKIPEAQVKEFPGFDHKCCWTDVWPTLVSTF
jgi:hypothetical protein